MNANELADRLEGWRLPDDLTKAATMLRQQQAEIEALKAGKIRAYDNGVEDGRKPNTHPYKPSKSEVDALLDNADYAVGIMREEIEEWKRKYKDMHNLATQAMSKVHQLEKEAQEK